jgi:hypothetical protein
MTHRSFTDLGGREWEAWDVTPQRLDRRVTEDRRAAAESDRRGQLDRKHAGNRRQRQRRSATDRRTIARHASRLPRTYSDGWLCFECTDEKRRLVPVPPGWARLSDDELAGLLENARVARAR